MFPVIPSDQLTNIPVGSIILVSGIVTDEERNPESTVWLVIAKNKATLIDAHFPYGETEDLDWFSQWTVTIVGKNQTNF